MRERVTSENQSHNNKIAEPLLHSQTNVREETSEQRKNLMEEQDMEMKTLLIDPQTIKWIMKRIIKWIMERKIDTFIDQEEQDAYSEYVWETMATI